MKDGIIRFVFDISTVSVALLDLYAVYDNMVESGEKATDWSLLLMSMMYICSVIVYWMFIRRYWTKQIKTNTILPQPVKRFQKFGKNGMNKK